MLSSKKKFNTVSSYLCSAVTALQSCQHKQKYCINFLPRDAMPKRGLCYRPVSVRPSRWCIVSRRLKIITKLLSRPGSPMILVLWPRAPILNSQGTPSADSQNIQGIGKFAIFDWNRCLSRKRYEIGPWIDTCRFRWPWVTFDPDFKVMKLLQV